MGMSAPFMDDPEEVNAWIRRRELQTKNDEIQQLKTENELLKKKLESSIDKPIP